MPKLYIVIKSSDIYSNEPKAFATREDAINYIFEETHQEHRRGVYLMNSYEIIVDNFNDTIDSYTLFLLRTDTMVIHTLIPTEEECVYLGIKKTT